MTRAKKMFAVLFLSATLVGGASMPASAQTQDGLVNVMVGDVTVLEDVNVAVGANVAATLCDIDVGPLALAVLGRAVAVDRSGKSRTICQSDAGPVRITQNA